MYLDIFESYKDALRKTVEELLSIKETFYYISLTVDEGGYSPIFSAWSHETYAKICENLSEEESLWVKWSYSDSPYFNFGKNNFFRADAIWESKGCIDEFTNSKWVAELKIRIASLENCFSALDKEKIFSKDRDRNQIMINVEMTPPTTEDAKRAKRLNPPEAIKDWLNEAAE